MGSKRVCFLYNHDLASQTRVLRQVEALLAVGYHVTVYCLAENAMRPKVEQRGNLTIVRIFKKRLYKYHLFSFRLLKTFFKLTTTQPRYDAIHVIDAPMILLGWLLSRFWGSKLVYDAAELWDSLFDEEKSRLLENGQLRKSERLRKIRQLERSRAFEIWSLSRCDGVISVCDSIGDVLKTKSRLTIPRYTTLRNIAPFYEGNSSSRIRDYFNIPAHQRIVLYQGQIAEKRGLGRALEAIKLLEDVVLVIIGPVLPADQHFFDALQHQMTKSEKLAGKVFYRGFIPADELLDWTASADLGLHPIINWNMNHYLCLPNKLFEYVQAGLPVAVSHFPEMKKLVERYEIGLTFDPDEPKQIADTIQRFFDSSDLQARCQANVRLAKQELCWEKEGQKLVALYGEIFKN